MKTSTSTFELESLLNYLEETHTKLNKFKWLLDMLKENFDHLGVEGSLKESYNEIVKIESLILKVKVKIKRAVRVSQMVDSKRKQASKKKTSSSVSINLLPPPFKKFILTLQKEMERKKYPANLEYSYSVVREREGKIHWVMNLTMKFPRGGEISNVFKYNYPLEGVISFFSHFGRIDNPKMRNVIHLLIEDIKYAEENNY